MMEVRKGRKKKWREEIENEGKLDLLWLEEMEKIKRKESFLISYYLIIYFIYYFI